MQFNNIILISEGPTILMVNKSTLRNSACIALAIFGISMSSLLMAHIYFQNQIHGQISNISILKDFRFPMWGQLPDVASSLFRQSFSLYDLEELDGRIISKKSNITKDYEYHFKYENSSFSQGNSGRLNFINKWNLQQISNNAASGNIKTINLAADKVFNYDFYAPPQRKFVILYNYLVSSLSTTFLQRFYTVYLHKYFFQYKDLVIDTVFKPLGFSIDEANLIYDNSGYGWSNIESFEKWVVLALKGSQTAKSTLNYEQLKTGLGLTSQQIVALTFEKSTLYNMISALNGTIKSKLMMAGSSFSYKCEKTYCSNEELIAFQISSSFLTGDSLFGSLNLNMTTKDLNSTFLADIEYQTFCDKNVGKFNCTKRTNMVELFLHNYLGDFEKMDLLWNNQNNYPLIIQKFKLSEGTGESIVKYVLDLYDNLIAKYESVYAWSQTTYNNLEAVVRTYQNMFIVELYSRAFYNKFINNKIVECEKYFIGDFQEVGQVICDKESTESNSWNFGKYLQAAKKIIKASLYIGDSRTEFSEKTGLSYDQLIQFFNNQEVSLFAKQLSQLEKIFKLSFGCSSNDLRMCTPLELFCRQWGSNQIFNNLPTDIFENKVKSINEWDTQNLLNGLNPDYYAIIGKEKSVDQCLKIMSSDHENGIFNLFNLVKMASKASNSPSDLDLLKYASRNVMEVAFNGIINTQNVDQLFTGFKSDIITKKNKMSLETGGAPWLQNLQKLVKTDNKAEIQNNQLLMVPQFDTIDTGIYNQDRTRWITKIWGQTTSSSKYTVYIGSKTDEDGNEVPVNIFKKFVTDRKVEGTNMFGFHPNVDEGENLKIFFNTGYQSLALTFVQSVNYQYPQQISKGLHAYKYKITTNKGQPPEGSFIGIEQLNQNFLSLSPQSFAIIEPTTGLTLQLSIQYTIKSNPIYTNFLLQNSQVDLFSSKQYYKRKGLKQIQDVIDVTNMRRIIIICAIACAGSALCVCFMLFGVVLRAGRKFEERGVDETPLIY